MSVPFSFIHAADLHLDSPFRGLSAAPAHVRDGLADATFAALRRLTELAIAREVDFIVMAGDLFDEADRSLRAQLALLKEWERLAEHGIAVFAIHGNHDHLGGKRASLQLPPSVHIFGAARPDCRPAYRRSGELAAHVYGMSYGERATTHNMAADYRLVPGGPYHIALLHGNVGAYAEHDPYAPCTLEQLVGADFHYWALGHIHTRAVLAEHPHVVYPGNTQGRNPRETGAKGCYIVEVSATGATELTFAPLDGVRWLEEDVSIAGLRTEQQLLDRLGASADRLHGTADGRSVMLRLRLIGRGPLHDRLCERPVLDALLEELREGGNWRGAGTYSGGPIAVEGHDGERRSAAGKREAGYGDYSHYGADTGPSNGASWLYLYALEAATGADIDWEALAGEESFAGDLIRLADQLDSDPARWRELASGALEELAAHPALGRFSRSRREQLPLAWLEQAKELTVGLLATGTAEEASGEEQPVLRRSGAGASGSD